MRRALHDWQKEQRSVAILEAAEALFKSRRGELPRVDDVAKKAKVAKGTVYLYFPSKEAIFLSLLEWRLSEWIEDALAEIAGASALSTDHLIDALIRYPAANRVVLDLASFSSALLETSVDEETALAYKTALAEKLEKISAVIAAGDLGVTKGEAMELLLRGYAYMLGLWQLVEPQWVTKSVRRKEKIHWFQISFEDEARAGLKALWSRA